ncbi:MAG: hypothetical protein WCH99_18485 [Verrucomicrobiota bacterium]
MITPSHQILALSIPVAIVITRQLLLTQKSMANAISSPTKEIQANLQFRASKLTMILKNIQGYRHGGIND